MINKRRHPSGLIVGDSPYAPNDIVLITNEGEPITEEGKREKREKDFTCRLGFIIIMLVSMISIKITLLTVNYLRG